MIETPKEPGLPELIRAMRFGFATIVLGVSYPNIRLALCLPSVEQLFRDMLGDKPLPPITSFVIHSQHFFIGASILIPLASIALIFSSRTIRSIYISGVLMIAVFVQLSITLQAVIGPLINGR